MDFLDHFNSLPGIDPNRTNVDLIECMLGYLDHRCGWICKTYKRGHGNVTRTAIEFLKWIEIPALYIVSTSAEARLWKSEGIESISWRQSFKGLRPKFVIMDNPLSDRDRKSVRTSAIFRDRFKRFPFPTLCIETYE